MDWAQDDRGAQEQDDEGVSGRNPQEVLVSEERLTDVDGDLFEADAELRRLEVVKMGPEEWRVSDIYSVGLNQETMSKISKSVGERGLTEATE